MKESAKLPYSRYSYINEPISKSCESRNSSICNSIDKLCSHWSERSADLDAKGTNRSFSLTHAKIEVLLDITPACNGSATFFYSIVDSSHALPERVHLRTRCLHNSRH